MKGQIVELIKSILQSKIVVLPISGAANELE